jgi:hypothetical protein
MTPLGIFKKKETKKTEKAGATPRKDTLLAELCKGNDELCNALRRTLLLNVESTKSGGGIDARVEKAQECEKTKDFVRARVEYQVAGELALYEGKVANVQKFFKKAAEVDSSSSFKKIFEYLAKKENAEKAVAVAKEYYKRAGKTAS